MKSEKHKTPIKKEEIKFPALMEHKDGEFVVLFITCHSGIVVDSQYELYKTGDYSSSWRTALDDNEWRIFQGSITLSN